MVDATKELPQVWQVRIPDPDCKGAATRCASVLIPVDDGKVQTALWQLDRDQNHTLDLNDIAGDISLTIPGGAANRLAQLLLGTQYTVRGKQTFDTTDAALSWVRTRIAIDRAYDTVQFLQSLPSHKVDTEFSFQLHKYSAADWQRVVAQLGVGASAYAAQMRSAYVAFENYAHSAKILVTTLSHESCTRYTSCGTFPDARVLDLRALTDRMKGDHVELTQKMATIDAFNFNEGIACWGDGCPASSISRNSSIDPFWYGGRIALRMEDTPVLLRLKSLRQWGPELLEKLAAITFTPTK